MREPPESVTTIVTVAEARALRCRLRVDHLLVVDRQGVLVGMVAGGEGDGAVDRPVGAVMSPGPVFIDYDDDVEEAAALMSEYDLDELPVVGARAELVGLLRRTDILPLGRALGRWEAEGERERQARAA